MTPTQAEMPKRIQRKRTKGWSAPEGAAFLRAITELPMGELQATVAAAELMTITNCGWPTYAVAQIILDKGAQELRYRHRSNTEDSSNDK